jgi:hypothetical protein
MELLQEKYWSMDIEIRKLKVTLSFRPVGVGSWACLDRFVKFGRGHPIAHSYQKGIIN